MSNRETRGAAVRGPLILTFTIGIGAYFAFAAVQGDYGLFKRLEIEAEARILERQKAELQAEVARLENLTHRMSDRFLDLDLLDEQARTYLGYIRADEIVIR